MEYSSQASDAQTSDIAPERQAIIDDLTRRQHAQADEITAITGREYITQRRLKRLDDQVAVLQRDMSQEEP
jgi:hypothetical protein